MVSERDLVKCKGSLNTIILITIECSIELDSSKVQGIVDDHRPVWIECSLWRFGFKNSSMAFQSCATRTRVPVLGMSADVGLRHAKNVGFYAKCRCPAATPMCMWSCVNTGTLT